MANVPRPPWYSFARRTPARPVQQYASDARASLNRGIAESAVLPVSLQMPVDPVVDKAVNQTRGEAVTIGQRPSLVTTPQVVDEEVNPLPPAVEPSAPVVTNRMPNLPAIDPLERPRLASASDAPTTRPDPAVGVDDPKTPVVDEVNPLPPAAEPAPSAVAADRKPEADPVKPKPSPAPSPSPSPTPLAAIETRKLDSQAVKAIPDDADSADSTILAEFLHKIAAKVKAKKHNHPTTVMASPQSVPAPKPKPVTVVIKPTPQAKPSSQVIETSDDCKATGCHHSSKKPCLRRLVRRLMHLGEFSDAPMVAPH